MSRSRLRDSDAKIRLSGMGVSREQNLFRNYRLGYRGVPGTDLEKPLTGITLGTKRKAIRSFVVADITLPPLSGIPVGWKATGFELVAILSLIAAMLIALNWSLSRTKSERECDLRPGPFSSAFSNGFQTYSCECSSPFHFGEACPTPVTMLPPNFAPAL